MTKLLFILVDLLQFFLEGGNWLELKRLFLIPIIDVKKGIDWKIMDQDIVFWRQSQNVAVEISRSDLSIERVLFRVTEHKSNLLTIADTEVEMRLHFSQVILFSEPFIAGFSQNRVIGVLFIFIIDEVQNKVQVSRVTTVFVRFLESKNLKGFNHIFSFIMFLRSIISCFCLEYLKVFLINIFEIRTFSMILKKIVHNIDGFSEFQG